MKTRYWFFLFLISILAGGIVGETRYEHITDSFAWISFFLFWAWFFNLLDD